MLQSLSSSFKRTRAERPSGAYMQGPSSRPGETSPMVRRRSSPKPPPPAVSTARERESLKEALALAMSERRYSDALNTILGLIALDPSDPRWPHKYGDVLRSLRRINEAAAAYRRAARRYELAGFPVRAEAMMRLAQELEGDSGPIPIDVEDSGMRVRNDATVPLDEQHVKALRRVS